MTPSTNTDKVLTRYIRARDGTKVALNYTHQEAAELRAAVQRIRLRGDRTPSLSLLARRSIGLYLELIHSSPRAMALELQALETLATPIATRTKKAPQARTE